MPKTKYNGTKDSNELYLAAYITNLGYEVGMPPRDSASDLWVDVGDKIVRIQFQSLCGKRVRTTNRPFDMVGKEQVSIGGKNRNRYHYAEENIDWLVTWNEKDHRFMWWNIETYKECPDFVDIKEVMEDVPVWCSKEVGATSMGMLDGFLIDSPR